MYQTIDQRLDLIDKCRRAERTVRFVYIDESGKKTWRHVDPISVKAMALMAWCLHRTEERRFNIARMRDLRMGPKQHEVLIPLPEPDQQPEDWA
jgi:predicted DNA-binding transcriptional regulator YafY